MPTRSPKHVRVALTKWRRAKNAIKLAAMLATNAMAFAAPTAAASMKLTSDLPYHRHQILPVLSHTSHSEATHNAIFLQQILSVCPSVRPSFTSLSPKRLNISSKFLSSYFNFLFAIKSTCSTPHVKYFLLYHTACHWRKLFAPRLCFNVSLFQFISNNCHFRELEREFYRLILNSCILAHLVDLSVYDTIRYDRTEQFNVGSKAECDQLNLAHVAWTRSQAVARIADRTAKNCRGHVT